MQLRHRWIPNQLCRILRGCKSGGVSGFQERRLDNRTLGVRLAKSRFVTSSWFCKNANRFVCLFGRICSARRDHGHRTVGQLLRHFHHNEKQDVPPATRQPSASQHVHLWLHQSHHQPMVVYFQVGQSARYFQVFHSSLLIIWDPWAELTTMFWLDNLSFL